jgi:hypothetical protein
MWNDSWRKLRIRCGGPKFRRKVASKSSDLWRFDRAPGERLVRLLVIVKVGNLPKAMIDVN